MHRAGSGPPRPGWVVLGLIHSWLSARNLPPMAPKRTPPKSSPSSTVATSPLVNALLVGGAVVSGLSILVTRGKVSWPPHQLLASINTLAGCLALIGPIILARGEAGEGGLGELLWMTGGLLVWVFDAVAVVNGQWRTMAWATPLSYQTMGLTILAVLLAGWRCRLAGRNWSWTNVTGWILGLFWVAMAVATFLPDRSLVPASR
jgi:hypothetical protein